MIRYPGSKDKITKKILRYFPQSLMDELWQSKKIEYREPFFGGGAVGFEVLRRNVPRWAHVWLNDKDFGMVCLWRSVLEQHQELIEHVRSFTPTTEAFYRFKEEDERTDMDPVRTGFQKLALHQISFSGLGAKAGGPIGGRKQSSEYNVDCRWRPTRHCQDIIDLHKLMKRFASVKITTGDFARLIDDAPSHAFIYADPPYYEKGGQLYKHNMSEEDHRRLAVSFRGCRAPWVLSYDDHELIRSLYDWADIESIDLTYTIAKSQNGSRRKNSEIVIVPRADALARTA